MAHKGEGVEIEGSYQDLIPHHHRGITIEKNIGWDR
jgi:hypothetical protein